MSDQQNILTEDYERWHTARTLHLSPLPSPAILEGHSVQELEASWPFPEVILPEAFPAPTEQPKSSTIAEAPPQSAPNVSGKTRLGPYTPTLILHGGSGSITRAKLPPALYAQYSSSLLTYFGSTHEKLKSGASALDAACHAVSLMEDDPLFNCGRGSVFTEKGTIEMEASVMMSSVQEQGDGDSGLAVPTKRAASVSMIKGTRHPIMLAKEVLLAGGDGLGGVGTMHCHLSGHDVEDWGWKEKRLEQKDPGWFWTRKRWREHLRDLENRGTHERSIPLEKCSVPADVLLVEDQLAIDLCSQSHASAFEDEDNVDYPSQGTVGTVCMDSWGNLAVATSTGGLTNKKVGRIGDTPTLGAGFWAESWDEGGEQQVQGMPGTSKRQHDGRRLTFTKRIGMAVDAGFGDILKECFPSLPDPAEASDKLSPPTSATEHLLLIEKEQPVRVPRMSLSNSARIRSHKGLLPRHRAVALGGTGNGDSFLRTTAVRTAAAICRFGSRPLAPITLAEAITHVAGPGGELQRSAGDRWQKTFEGQGGIIGIELYGDETEGKVVFDFNCGGMWRAWLDGETGKPRVMVFKGVYET